MNQITSRRQNIHYSVLNAAYWMSYCITLSFASVFLVARGYSNSEIGMILASGLILGMLSQPLIATCTDRSRKHTPVFFITATSLVGICVILLLLVFPGHTRRMSLAFVLFSAVNMALQPLINAFAFYLEHLGYSIQFGVARGIGSLAFSILAALLGLLTQHLDVFILPIAGLFAQGLLIATIHSFRVGHVTVSDCVPLKQTQHTNSILRHNPAFLILLVSTALLFFDHAAMNNYMLQVVVNVGGNSGNMGALSSYCALLELPAMFLFDRLHRRFRCATLLKVSAVFFVVKGLLVLLAGSVPALFAGMFFQSLSFALFIPASVRYVGETMRPTDVNRGQSCVTAMIAVGNILASAVGGVLIDATSVHGFLLCALCVGCVGLALMLLGLKSKV